MKRELKQGKKRPTEEHYRGYTDHPYEEGTETKGDLFITKRSKHSYTDHPYEEGTETTLRSEEKNDGTMLHRPSL